MRKCSSCQVAIKGEWDHCPLCHTSLNQSTQSVPSPYPDVPMQFNQQKIAKTLLAISFVIIGASFALGLLWRGNIQGLRGALFGILTMWLVVLILIRKRRNLVKSILYLLIVLSLLCMYLDYLVGWTAWSTTYAVPIICSFSLFAMFLIARYVKMRIGDYILYFFAGSLLGLIPTLFLIFDWVRNPLPALLSVGFSLLFLLLIVIFRGREIVHELQKRTFI